MRGRPPKSAEIIKLENITHLSKSALEQREQAEAALFTGRYMKMRPEVKANRAAREEFEGVVELLRIINKDDALYEGVISRYCILRAECFDFEKKREIFARSMNELKREYKEGKLEAPEYYRILSCMQRNVQGLDKQIMSKRNMMLAIEKENLMTIASALRSIPKKPEKKKSESDMRAFLEKHNSAAARSNTAAQQPIGTP